MVRCIDCVYFQDEKIGKKIVWNCVYHYYSQPTWINPPALDEYPGSDTEDWNCRFFKNRKDTMIEITNDALKHNTDKLLEAVNDAAKSVCIEAENNGLKLDKDKVANFILECMVR